MQEDTIIFVLPFVKICGFLKKRKKSKLHLGRPKKHKDSIEAVYDGQLHKEHFNSQGFFHGTNRQTREAEAHVSLEIKNDGLAIFKRSSFSIWPLYAVVNELYPAARFSRDKANLL